jgi:hypothetical protein
MMKYRPFLIFILLIMLAIVNFPAVLAATATITAKTAETAKTETIITSVPAAALLTEPKTTAAPATASTTTATVAATAAHDGNAKSQVDYKVSDDHKQLQISRSGKVIKIISLKEIPVFDIENGKPVEGVGMSLGDGDVVNPETDYRFDYGLAYDPKRNIVYFAVHNHTTAGNVNAAHALFTYNLTNSKITLVDRREGTAYFTFNLSPSGKYVVFGAGSHGGWCYSSRGLIVFDLEKKKERAALSLAKGYPSEPDAERGGIDFGKWRSDSSFLYTEEEYASFADCQKSESGKKTKRTKVFNIKRSN